ncbi:MAG: Unknown protein [uncultured Sulfurovum sp.]|uniref:DUF2442 domain-containing protein n=1 Tax=uncultured Sulfurovum sp. TaxID=269237 RepID=A0A6S6TSU8_9BACT|nr:MAG: Unknown protein [uncultured Sulfurovum sp.]
MNPQVISVEPKAEHKVLLTFDNQEVRIFDMSPYIDRSSFFKQLEDEEYFKTVRVSLGSIQWKNGQDLSPHTLYSKSKLVSSLSESA